MDKAKLSARDSAKLRELMQYVGAGGCVIDRGDRRPLVARNTASQTKIIERFCLEYLVVHGYLRYDPAVSAPFCHGYTRTEIGKGGVY